MRVPAECRIGQRCGRGQAPPLRKKRRIPVVAKQVLRAAEPATGRPTMALAICVYSSSSDDIDGRYFAAARELGRLMGERGHTLVFGAGNIGLMNAMAHEVKARGGRIVGVIPRALKGRDLARGDCDELIVTDGLRERKTIMEERSAAFIALPGGFGTLEELLETITLKQLGYHAKPVVILDVDGYYDALLKQFERIFSEGFARQPAVSASEPASARPPRQARGPSLSKAVEPKFRELFHVAGDPRAALDYIERHGPTPADGGRRP